MKRYQSSQVDHTNFMGLFFSWAIWTGASLFFTLSMTLIFGPWALLLFPAIGVGFAASVCLWLNEEIEW
jgi:hypothetical protein